MVRATQQRHCRTFAEKCVMGFGALRTQIDATHICMFVNQLLLREFYENHQIFNNMISDPIRNRYVPAFNTRCLLSWSLRLHPAMPVGA